MLRTASARTCRAAFGASSRAHVLINAGIPASSTGVTSGRCAAASFMTGLPQSITGHSPHLPSKPFTEAFRWHSGVIVLNCLQYYNRPNCSIIPAAKEVPATLCLQCRVDVRWQIRHLISSAQSSLHDCEQRFRS